MLAVATMTIARCVSALKPRRRTGLLMALVGAALLLGMVTAQLARHGLRVNDRAGVFWTVSGVAVAALSFLGAALRLYLGRYRYGSFEEIRALLIAVALTICLACVVDLTLGGHRAVNVGVVVLGGIVAVMAMFGTRYGWRLARESHPRPDPVVAEPLFVFGAGEGGAWVAAAPPRTRDVPYHRVEMLDDDPATLSEQLGGVRVRGGQDAKRTVKVLPAVGDLVDNHSSVGGIRDIDLPDLLGRRPIETDVGTAAAYLAGRRVLVTGAGGSIGSELCRQIRGYRPAELVMLDRDDSSLLATRLSIRDSSRDKAISLVLGDVRDVDLVRALFAERKPQVVFHAAALKHLPFLENAPGEAVKTNVWGTLSVLEAAAASGVERFVNISTDKAANPTSVLGFSKRITERLTAQVAAGADGLFASVRFGNVLGSRGSVLTIFMSQIAAGGPVTVTHPEVTRYFMTVREAVQLVVRAGAIGAAGDVFVFDMGTPVRIDDIARRLVSGARSPAEIVYLGLGAGEKLHEELFGPGEIDERPDHPLISRISVPALDTRPIALLDPWAAGEHVRTRLRHFGLCDDLSATRSHRAAGTRATVPTPAESPEQGPTPISRSLDRLNQP